MVLFWGDEEGEEEADKAANADCIPAYMGSVVIILSDGDVQDRKYWKRDVCKTYKRGLGIEKLRDNA